MEQIQKKGTKGTKPRALPKTQRVGDPSKTKVKAPPLQEPTAQGWARPEGDAYHGPHLLTLRSDQIITFAAGFPLASVTGVKRATDHETVESESSCGNASRSEAPGMITPFVSANERWYSCGSCVGSTVNIAPVCVLPTVPSGLMGTVAWPPPVCETTRLPVTGLSSVPSHFVHQNSGPFTVIILELGEILGEAGGGVSVKTLLRLTFPSATSNTVDAPAGNVTFPLCCWYTPQLPVPVTGRLPTVVPFGSSKCRAWLVRYVAACAAIT